MAIDPAELADAESGGRRAYLDGEPLTRNPFSGMEGSPTRPHAFAWRKGWNKQAAQEDQS